MKCLNAMLTKTLPPALEREIDRLKRRAQELREELILLRERAPYQLINPRELVRLASKLAHVEDKIFKLRQMRLIDGR